MVEKGIETLHLISLLNKQGDHPTAYTLGRGGGLSRRRMCDLLNELTNLGWVDFYQKQHRPTARYFDKKTGELVVKHWNKACFIVTHKGDKILEAQGLRLPSE